MALEIIVKIYPLDIRQDISVVAGKMLEKINKDDTSALPGEKLSDEERFNNTKHKLTQLRDDPADANLGDFRGLANYVDVDGLLQDDQNLYEKYGEICSEQFDLELRREIVKSKAEEYLQKLVI